MNRGYNFLRNLLIKQIFDDVNLMAAKLDKYVDSTKLIIQIDKHLRLNAITSYDIEDNNDSILIVIKYRDDKPIGFVVPKLNEPSYHDAMLLKYKIMLNLI